MSPLTITAPSDAQLAFIAKLCHEQGWDFPPAVHSMQEASAIIDAMRASTYRPEAFAPIDDTVPF